MKKNHLLKILSSLIVNFSDVQAENFYFQVKFINCYLREIISFTKKLTLETGASLDHYQPVIVFLLMLSTMITHISTSVKRV